jgi:hypothetical protein
VVDLPEEYEREHLHPNSEGEPCVTDRIPGKYVTLLD